MAKGPDPPPLRQNSDPIKSIPKFLDLLGLVGGQGAYADIDNHAGRCGSIFCGSYSMDPNPSQNFRINPRMILAPILVSLQPVDKDRAMPPGNLFLRLAMQAALPGALR